MKFLNLLNFRNTNSLHSLFFFFFFPARKGRLALTFEAMGLSAVLRMNNRCSNCTADPMNTKAVLYNPLRVKVKGLHEVWAWTSWCLLS